MRTAVLRRPARCRNDLAPSQRVTIAEAAAILGVSSIRVVGLIREGFLTDDVLDSSRPLVRAQVEELSLATYDRIARRHDRHPYWVSGRQAADTLGVTSAELAALADNDRVPHIKHPDGTVLFRREQLLNRRRVRAGRGWGPG